MRSPRIWLAWQARYHRWWWLTHLHAAESAKTDAEGFLIPGEDTVILDYSTAKGEARRLLNIMESENVKAARRLSRRHRALDRLAQRR